MVQPPRDPLSEAQRRVLLRHARLALQAAVNGRAAPDPVTDDPRLLEPRGAFVTLRNQGELRGCIGCFEAECPLVETVIAMTTAAATRDHRFLPVSPDELDAIRISISALTPLVVVGGVEDVVVGRDGVRVSMGGRSGTLLPQVAEEQGWDARQLVEAVCTMKAGLPADAYKHGAVIETYGADVFGED